MKGTSCLLSVLLVFSFIIVAFSPIAAHAETFSNVSEFPNFDMDCYVADLFTKDGHSLNTLIESELNSESRNKIMKNSIESNSILMGSMTAWQVATFEASDVTSDSVTELGYYESIILSSINTAMKSSRVKDFFDNAVIKDGKMLFSSFKDILKSEYFITDFSLDTYNSLSAENQSAYIKSFGEAFKKQYPKLDKTGDALKIFSTVVKAAKSFEECMNNYAAYAFCSLTNKHLTKVINDLYEQCPAEKVTMKAALLNISSACTSIELDLGADALDAIYRGTDIIFGVLTDGWVTKVISAHPAGLALMLGRAVGKTVSNILFSTDAICENYYKMCCFDEFEQLVRSVTRYEMNTYTENKTNDNANNMFWAIRLMFNINEVGCDLSIDYAKTIYEKSIAGIFLDKTEYENYKKTVEFIRNCKRSDYSSLMTSYVFYLEEDYPEIYAAYKKLIDEIENPVVHATGISFSKKHMTLGLADDAWFFWNNAEVTPSNATNRAVSYSSSDESIVSIKPGNTLMIELHQTGTATITATAEDGGFSDLLIIDVVEGHGTDGIHLEDPATDIKASGKCGENAYWNLYKNGTLKIYGSGKTYDYESVKDIPWYNQQYNIKRLIISGSILKIGKNLFNNLVLLSDVSFISDITDIGDYAFRSCSKLKKMAIPISVVTIGNHAFDGCKKIEDIDIPKNVTIIGEYAFYNCESIVNVIIPENVLSIGKNAFAGCKSLKSIVVPGNIKTISESMFKNCENLSKVVLEKGVTTIGFCAFYGCSALTDITIPESVISFDNDVFWYCNNLEELRISKNLISVGQIPFYECLNLKRIIVDPQNQNFTSINGSLYRKNKYSSENKLELVYYARNDNTSFIVPQNVNTIEDYAFHDCTKLETISLPDGLETIEGNAFSKCANLRLIIIPNSVYSIASDSFRDCTNLTSVTLSNSTKIIQQEAFENCSSLQVIHIPDSINKIEMGAFSGCTNLEHIYYSGSKESWNSIEIRKNNESLNLATVHFITLNKSNLILYPGQNETLIATLTPTNNGDDTIFWASENTNVATVSNGVVTAVNPGTTIITAISANELKAVCYITVNQIDVTGITLNKSSLSLLVGNSERLTATVTPNNATDKSVSWYSHSPSIASVSSEGIVTALTPGTTIIKARTSNGVEASCYITVTSISWTLDDGTLTISGNGPIEDNAFAARSDIKKVVIQNGVTGIGEYAFYNSKNIESVSIGNDVKEIGYRAFLQCDKLKSITIGSNVESIGESAFYNCPELTSISIPSSVTNIGNYAFYHCLKLKTISITDNISHLGREVFYNTAFYNNESNWNNNALYLNKYLVHVKDSVSGSYQIKNGTICIADRVFGGCETLTEVNVPNSVLYLGNWTFDGCTNLKKVTLGNQVKSIGYDTFSECTSLESLSIPSSVTSIGDFAFSCCESLTNIVIPNSVTFLGERAFLYCSGLKSVTLGNSVPNIEYETFEGCTSLTNITFGNNIQTIGEYAFKECSSIKNIVIPDSVITIEESAFDNCTNLESIKMGKKTKTIGAYSFWYCDSLSTVYIGTSVTEIGKGAFGQSSKLQDVYYDGSESQWKKISIDSNNEYLLNATIHFKTAEQIEVTDVSLNKTKISLIIGNNEVLVASILPIDATDKSLTWTSSNSGVVTVNNGKVTGIKIGTATITARTSNGKAASCIVTVTPASVSEEIVGDVNLDGTISISDATEVQKYLAEFIELNGIQKNLADTNGDGTITITDATEIQKYLAEFINHFKQPNSIILNSTNITLVAGNTQNLSANIMPNDATNKKITWTSSDNSIATVSNGTVTAKSPGTATITATTYNGKFAKCTVIVKPIEVSSISFNNGNIYLSPNGSYQITITIMPDNAFDKSVTWLSSDTTVATVDSKGYVVGKAPGTSTIIAKTTNNKSTSCLVTVLPITVDSISLNTNSIAMDEGETCQLIATVSPNNATDKSLSWSTDDNSVATVSNNGIVTAISGGTAEITVKTSNGKTAKCQVNVRQKIMPTSIEVLPVRLTLVKGDYYDLNPKVLPTNAEDKTIMWTSNNSSAVSVDNNGRVAAKKSGQSAIITAKTVNGLTSNVEVDVVNKADNYGNYWELGVEYGGTIYKAPVTVGTPSYIRDSGDSLYFVSTFDSELYQGAKLKIHITSGSSGSYDSYTVTLSSNTYDYKANKGYIPLCQYLSNYKNKYIRVYTEIILANGQVIKPANLGTDDAIYLYIT